MKVNHDYHIGDKVLYPAIDAAPFTVIGIRPDHLEIEGDFSGGTHNVCQRDWVLVGELEYYVDPEKSSQAIESKRLLLKEHIGDRISVFGAMGTYGLTATLIEVADYPFKTCRVRWSDRDTMTYYFWEVALSTVPA